MTIQSFDHAEQLVHAGDVTAADARTMQEAIYLQYAFEKRLGELGNCETTQAIDEGKYLADELANLNCDWGNPDSPECDAHLY